MKDEHGDLERRNQPSQALVELRGAGNVEAFGAITTSARAATMSPMLWGLTGALRDARGGPRGTCSN